jgi:uncharacterized protein YecE (DUF72 family)
MVDVYVGTSGWMYDWNEGGSLDWYVEQSGLNAVELNASFYRFPFLSQVKSWAVKGSRLRWAVKVHRSITHVRRMGSAALEVWSRFRERFAPLDSLVDFYLFQLPPSFAASEEGVRRLRAFAEACGLGCRMAVEFRHESWFEGEGLELCEELGVTFVSVDSPIGTWVASSNGVVYLRLHGRGAWYAYEYSEEELAELASRVAELSPIRVYAFFNNDHWMLENALQMLETLRNQLG